MEPGEGDAQQVPTAESESGVERSQVKGPYVGVIDIGTNTVGFSIFSAGLCVPVASHHVDINTKSPQEGWAEQDPYEYLSAITESTSKALEEFPQGKSEIVAIGITNQRETTVAWDEFTGEPLYNALLWCDIRTDPTVDTLLAKFPNNDKEYLKPLCGLPVSPYFSALKMRWLMDRVPAVRKAVLRHACKFGTVDSWVVWNLTGGVNLGTHITDVTNASRTMLMNINTLQWDESLCKIFQVPMETLPVIKSSSEIYGIIQDGPLSGIPISGILGNQQSALVGQNCLLEGQAKNTYRNGCFLLYNTGRKIVFSTHGLVTTVGYQFGPNSPPIYALEGSVAVAGSALEWLHTKLNVLDDISETETLAENVMTTGDVYFVPCFNGLYAPYWRKDARGIMCGITQFTTKQHIIRAALEAVCFQTRDILEAMHKDCGVPLTRLQVDGVLTDNNLLMQLQADLCGIPVVRSKLHDVTSVGAAIAAGSAEGIRVWPDSSNIATDVRDAEFCERIFIPITTHNERDLRYTKWKMAVQRSLGWAATKRSIPMTEDRYRLLSSIPAGVFLFTSFILLVVAKELRG